MPPRHIARCRQRQPDIPNMKRAITSVLTILILYYLTLLAFGVGSLGKQLTKDSNSTYHSYRWTNSVVVVGNVRMKSISLKFSNEGGKVEEFRAANYEEIRPYIMGKDTYHYVLLTNSKYYPLITVEETEHINEYVAEWEKKYVWCFVGWIQLYDRMVGIS